MMRGARDVVESRGDVADLLTPGSSDSWTLSGVEGVRSVDGLAAWHGLTVNSNRLKRLTSSSRLVVIGADSIDGAYGIRFIAQRVSMLNIAVAQGRNAELANFSIRKQPASDALAVLRQLDPRVRITARDPFSQERARRMLGREVGLVPDIAAHMDATKATSNFEFKAPTVVFVPNAHLADMESEGWDGVLSACTEIVESIVGRGWQVAILAHDVRDEPGDVRLSNEIAEKVQARSGVSVIVPDSGAHAKALIGTASAVVTARMHAAVAALSSGIPTVGLDYVDKFVGQFSWYDAAEFVTPWRSVPDVQAICLLLDEAVGAKDVFEVNSRIFKERPVSWLTSERADA